MKKIMMSKKLVIASETKQSASNLIFEIATDFALAMTFYRSIKICTLCVILATTLSAQTGIEIIDRVDKNVVANTISYDAKMIISLAGQVREKEFIGYIQGKKLAYLEFTAPARDKGTRFLKLNDEMWIYVKEVEKATKIAGHMLRQSLVGSDFSYDDITSNEKRKEQYNINFKGIDTVLNQACYNLELTAKIEEVTYYKRELWIDKEYYYPLKEELYAKSGKIMKEITISDFEKIGDKNYPTKIRMENKLRQNTYTELILGNVKLDVSIPERIFTKAYLERK
jgi:outer membrane lipoprotein-sorting protein